MEFILGKTFFQCDSSNACRSHPYLTSLTNDEIISEILWTSKVIYDVLGIVPTFMRPPYGDVDDRVRGIMKALGLDIVLWNRDVIYFKFHS